MADNVSLPNGSGTTFIAAADELSDSSLSPKVSILDGSGSPTPISPATSGKQDTIIARLPAALTSGGALKVAEVGSGSVTIGTLTTDASGTAWVTFASQACSMIDLGNFSGTTIEYRRGGAGSSMLVINNTIRRIHGISNANEISIRRSDQALTTVSVRCEFFA